MQIKVTVYGGGEATPPQTMTRRRPCPPPIIKRFCLTCNREGMLRSRDGLHTVTCPDCEGRKFHLIRNRLLDRLLRYAYLLREGRVLEFANAGAFLACLYVGMLPDRISTGIVNLYNLIF